MKEDDYENLQNRSHRIGFCLVTVTALQAQTATGEVNGTVHDPNGAAIPGAIVKLINQATKTETETTTGQNGNFTFVNLRPASYVLMVETKGFKKTLTKTFSLGVSETITQNVSLSVGEMSEVVEVRPPRNWCNRLPQNLVR